MHDTSVALRTRSLAGRLMDMLAAPRDVFDEVIAEPPGFVNWFVPTLLVCATSLVLLHATGGPGAFSAASVGVILVSAFVGTFWSASVLWVIGRWFLHTRFPYIKALEVVGLTGIIAALGYALTTLLILASGNIAARPALAFLMMSADAPRNFLARFDLFHLWSTAVLSVGLARLSGVSFREASFWVFGYWFVLPLTLLLLA